MRMSDWSSDVRSSELGKLAGAERHVGQLRLQFLRLDQLHAEIDAENCQREQHQEDRPGEDVEAVEVHRLVEVRLDAVGQDVADHQRRARVAVAAHVERHAAEEDDGVEMAQGYDWKTTTPKPRSNRRTPQP